MVSRTSWRAAGDGTTPAPSARARHGARAPRPRRPESQSARTWRVMRSSRSAPRGKRDACVESFASASAGAPARSDACAARSSATSSARVSSDAGAGVLARGATDGSGEGATSGSESTDTSGAGGAAGGRGRVHLRRRMRRRRQHGRLYGRSFLPWRGIRRVDAYRPAAQRPAMATPVTTPQGPRRASPARLSTLAAGGGATKAGPGASIQSGSAPSRLFEPRAHRRLHGGARLPRVARGREEFTFGAGERLLTAHLSCSFRSDAPAGFGTAFGRVGAANRPY